MDWSSDLWMAGCGRRGRYADSGSDLLAGREYHPLEMVDTAERLQGGEKEAPVKPELHDIQLKVHLELPPRVSSYLDEADYEVLRDFGEWVDDVVNLACGDATGLGGWHDDLIPWICREVGKNGQ